MAESGSAATDELEQGVGAAESHNANYIVPCVFVMASEKDVGDAVMDVLHPNRRSGIEMTTLTYRGQTHDICYCTIGDAFGGDMPVQMDPRPRVILLCITGDELPHQIDLMLRQFDRFMQTAATLACKQVALVVWIHEPVVTSAARGVFMSVRERVHACDKIGSCLFTMRNHASQPHISGTGYNRESLDVAVGGACIQAGIIRDRIAEQDDDGPPDSTSSVPCLQSCMILTWRALTSVCCATTNYYDPV